ncbi:MAG TPA: MarR family winged helix-turn-helix transcriptional regulator [Acidimicrobiales bacterium]|nr:MarR family winged helix-turn-helix transcriptional regulator [Acidimicrobiales bacterium]
MAPHPVRRLGTLVEPLAAGVYFAPEAHAAYTELGGLDDFWAPYYASRGASLGDVPSGVVAAAFGVFNPAHMHEQLTQAWAKAPASKWWDARVQGATAQLERLLGPNPEGAERATELLRRIADASPHAGRPFFGGLAGQAWPGTLHGDLWHAADLVREHRGDTHTATWVAHGLTAPEIMMLTELWWGLPHGSYLASRHWDADAIASGLDRLRREGWIDGDPPTLTDAGIAYRVSIEDKTDEAERGVLDGVLTDAERDELFAILKPMAATICAGGGYPADPNERSLPGVED